MITHLNATRVSFYERPMGGSFCQIAGLFSIQRRVSAVQGALLTCTGCVLRRWMFGGLGLVGRLRGGCNPTAYSYHKCLRVHPEHRNSPNQVSAYSCTAVPLRKRALTSEASVSLPHTTEAYISSPTSAHQTNTENRERGRTESEASSLAAVISTSYRKRSTRGFCSSW